MLIVGLCAVLFVLILNKVVDHSIIQKNGSADKSEALEVSSTYPLTDNDWSVKYRIKNNGIYFENVIPRFSFQGSDSKLSAQEDGYIAVFIDGKWKMNVHQSIFIVKKISQGKHEISLHLKRKDGTDYGINKKIFVHVR
jgi:hypothetical protein